LVEIVLVFGQNDSMVLGLSKGTFKYTLYRLGRGFAQTVKVPSYGSGGGGWPNRHINFIVAKKC